MASQTFMSFPAKCFVSALFALAMGYCEAMIVVYLRALYYPEGFSFPLKPVPFSIIILEVFREAATLVMLISAVILAGRRFWERFGYFIFMFGVWDISFYGWLKMTIDWPSSLLDWDILFLIPAPWIGPVIAPVTVSFLMVMFGYIIMRMCHMGYGFRPPKSAWITAGAGTGLILYSFMKDTGATLHQELPEPFAYHLLIFGVVLLLIAFIITYRNL